MATAALAGRRITRYLRPVRPAGWPPGSPLDAILGAGSYVLSGNNFDPGVTGPFSITANTWDGEFKNCNDAFGTTGVTANQTMATGCSYASGQLVDPVGIYLGQGQQLRFDVSSSVFDPKLDLYQVNATVPIETDDNSGGGTSARITFTAASAGMYVLLATSPAVQQVGAYTLTVTGLVAGRLPGDDVRRGCVASRTHRTRASDRRCRGDAANELAPAGPRSAVLTSPRWSQSSGGSVRRSSRRPATRSVRRPSAFLDVCRRLQIAGIDQFHRQTGSVGCGRAHAAAARRRLPWSMHRTSPVPPWRRDGRER